MAVHNGGRHLREAVDSVLRQTHANFEFVIVDDGSLDDSRAIIRGCDDPRIRLLVNERNLGLSASLNRGLAEARTSLVARQDADDISELDRVERQVAFMEAQPDVALLGSGYRKVDEHGAVMGERVLPTDATTLRWRLLFYCPFVHGAVMFRRAAVENVGLYDTGLRYSMDRDLWSRLALRSVVANLPDLLFRYRLSPESMTATYGGVREESATVTTRTRQRFLAGMEPVTAADLDVKVASPAMLDIPSADRLSHARNYARELLHLQSRFSSFYRLSLHDRLAHRAEVHYRLGLQLLRAGRTFSDPPSRRLARRLLWQGAALERLLEAWGRRLPEEVASVGAEARRELRGR